MNPLQSAFGGGIFDAFVAKISVPSVFLLIDEDSILAAIEGEPDAEARTHVYRKALKRRFEEREAPEPEKAAPKRK